MLTVTAVHEDGLRFTGRNGRGHELAADYIPPLGKDEGFMGLELLLVSLACCSGQTTASLLRRMGSPPEGMRVEASGEKQDEHPKILTAVTLRFSFGAGVAEEHARKAVALSEERFCPVWAMLKGTVPIAVEIAVAA
jgi:putative redox protein